MKMRLIQINQSILNKNDRLADELRTRFARSGTYVVNLLSSPGSGKTTLLQETLGQLAPRHRVAALVGDQATERDAERLRRSGVPVRQITTGAECRLDADMIGRALSGLDVDAIDVLFIENVGNLICPAEYDLGESLRAVLLSVTEGEDKPLKYPLAFNTAGIALVTKIDIADAVGFDAQATHTNIQAVHPGMKILELSARTGVGFDAWVEFLEQRIGEARAAPLPS